MEVMEPAVAEARSVIQPCFAGLPISTFSLEQLPAPDAFVKVCAVRQLMALHAVVFLPKEEAERWRRRRGFQDVDLRGVIG